MVQQTAPVVPATPPASGVVVAGSEALWADATEASQGLSVVAVSGTGGSDAHTVSEAIHRLFAFSSHEEAWEERVLLCNAKDRLREPVLVIDAASVDRVLAGKESQRLTLKGADTSMTMLVEREPQLKVSWKAARAEPHPPQQAPSGWVARVQVSNLGNPSGVSVSLISPFPRRCLTSRFGERAGRAVGGNILSQSPDRVNGRHKRGSGGSHGFGGHVGGAGDQGKGGGKAGGAQNKEIMVRKLLSTVSGG